MTESFIIKDCTLIAIATGEKAQNLRELRDKLENTASSCIYYHFWGGMLRPRFDDPEYRNDFAAWAAHSIHDKVLAERLSIIDPTNFQNLEELRKELIDVIEERLDERLIIPWADIDKQFYFVRSQIVVFDTEVQCSDLPELKSITPNLSLGSIFYHFIDARRRTQTGLSDFVEWILDFGSAYIALTDKISNIDPYFNSLSEIRTCLVETFNQFSFNTKEDL